MSDDENKDTVGTTLYDNEVDPKSLMLGKVLIAVSSLLYVVILLAVVSSGTGPIMGLASVVISGCVWTVFVTACLRRFWPPWSASHTPPSPPPTMMESMDIRDWHTGRTAARNE